jgi:superfamily II DNA or RNA helicase
MPHFFRDTTPNIEGNALIRAPQAEAFRAMQAIDLSGDEKEFGVVLPVGCGKSGTIAITPFAFQSMRTLVVAPGLNIADQLARDFDPSNAQMFYLKCAILDGRQFPEPVEIRGRDSNLGDLEEADIVITNIQQLQGGDANRWIRELPDDFFDLILFDEGHHGVAESWEVLRQKFRHAKIVGFSATPMRADGRLMPGRVIYAYPIYRAIQAGYVKRLKAVQLNPRTLRYVRREDQQEVEVTLEEVQRLGEVDADFRRSIVTSEETLNTIVDASIRALELRRAANNGEQRLKIIASALNFEHCRQIVQAYRARNLRADYVHSREDSAANEQVIARLNRHELDVIVQVRKLGEGFDHPWLSVAAVFSIFSKLSPFIQFVGRVMRVIVQNAPQSPLNQGVVVYHAGANIAQRWEDFRTYSEADQLFFDALLPVEGIDPSSGEGEREINVERTLDELEVRAQTDVHMQEIPLLNHDEAAAIRLLQESGIIPADFDPESQVLTPVPTTRVRERQAMRQGLADRNMQEAARILGGRGVNPGGSTLDPRHIRTNLIVMKSALDRHANSFVGRGNGERSEFRREEHDRVNDNYDAIVAAAIQEVFDGH